MPTIITPITMPFASGRTSGTLPNVIPAIVPNSPADNVANQTTGFPVLQATSLGGSGIPVQEGEMNGVLNFYTNLLFQMGQGYQFTFDAALSNKISGYPQGAILWCASNSTFQISLQNNNDKNFVTNPSFINDGVNWQNLANAGEFPDITDNATTGSVTIGGRVVGGTQTLKGLAADGNTATVVAYGNSGGSGTASAFFGVLNPSLIPVSGFQINTIGRPYIAGDITITNQYNSAIINDLTKTGVYGHLVVTKTPIVGGGSPAKYVVTLAGSVTMTVTGGVPTIPPISVSSLGGLSSIAQSTSGVLTTIQSSDIDESYSFADSETGNISFYVRNNHPLLNGTDICRVNVTFLAN